MARITVLIEVKMGTGLWGSSTAEHTKNYIRGAINELKNTAKTLDTTLITVSNEQLNILAKGTKKQIDELAHRIKNCVITIDDVKITE